MNPQWIATILIRDLEGMKAELAAFPDDVAVWALLPGITNSAGTLALHLAGNIRWFIGATLGGDGYVRDREREFADRGLSRAELLAGLDLAIAAVRQAFRPGVTIDLEGIYPDVVSGKFQVRTGDWLLQLVAHLGFHLGQVGYLRRVLTGQGTSTGQLALGRLATAVQVG